MQGIGLGLIRLKSGLLNREGYDSTAINAMASVYGLDKVFTVTKSKEQIPFSSQG